MPIVPEMTFSGSLSRAETSIAVEFTAEIDDEGRLRLTFKPVAPTADAMIMLGGGLSPGQKVRDLCLQGHSAVGESLESTRLNVVSFRHGSGELGFEGRCREATLTRADLRGDPKPVLIWGCRRFESFFRLRGTLNGNDVSFAGSKPDPDRPQGLTGSLWIVAPSSQVEADWWTQADAAADHLFRVMSFASGTYLRPYFERRWGGGWDVILVRDYSDTPESFLAPFYSQHLEPVFKYACGSDGSIRASFKLLDAALQWLLTPAHYDEIRLLAAMTALENVVEVSYPSDDYPIVPRADFKAFAGSVESMIEAAGLPPLLKQKLQELNRLSFREKLERYITENGIVTADFPEDGLRSVITARNSVVHRGVYPHDEPDQYDIWEHILVARELVIRVLLTVLQFEGNYVSNLYRSRQLRFPSCRRLSDDRNVEIAADDPAGAPKPLQRLKGRANITPGEPGQ